MSAPAGSPILSAASGLANSFASQAVTGERTNLLPGNAGAPSSSAEGAGASGSVREEDEDGLDVPIGFAYFFQGVIGDFKRRFKHQFTSDYYDGLRWQSLSAGLFTFFGVLMTTISLGHRVQDSTMGQPGYVEYMLLNSVAGSAYTLRAAAIRGDPADRSDHDAARDALAVRRGAARRVPAVSRGDGVICRIVAVLMRVLECREPD